MSLLGSILLGVSAFIYVVMVFVFLNVPSHPTGEQAMGLLSYFFLTIPFGIFLFLTWCTLLPEGGFDWLGGGRGSQLFLLIATGLASTTMISTVAVMRGDPHAPISVRPLMPWGLYAIPFLLIFATATLKIPALAQEIPAAIRQGTLIGCGAVALLVCGGMLLEWFVSAQKDALRQARDEAESHERNIARIVAEVERLDPVKDLGMLFNHAEANRYPEPRELARKKILAHPDLQRELVRQLGSPSPLPALAYLETNTAPDPAALAEPVRRAITRLIPWVEQQVGQGDPLDHAFCQSEIGIMLGVAEKYSVYDVDYRPAFRELRAIFDQPKLRDAPFAARSMIDIWLAHRKQLESSSTASR